MRCVFIYVLPHRLARLLQAAVYNDDARHILATMPPWRRRGERERETTTSSWLNLECNHIWYSSSFWKDKPSSSSSSLVGLLSKSEIQIGLPFILAKNYTSLRKTMLEIIYWKMATRKGLWKWLCLGKSFIAQKILKMVSETRMSLLEVLNFFVCFSSTFDNFGYFADLFQTSKRSAVVCKRQFILLLLQSPVLHSHSTEVFS